MERISAVVIAKNSEEVIEDCLRSLEFCDEIIVVDTGSKDRTLQIVEKYKAKVYEINIDDFSELRNVGLQKANFEWILYVDTDERVNQQLSREIIKAVRENKFPVFKLRRKNFYFEKYEWPYIEKLERLFRKKNLKSWYGKVHESPIFEGKVGVLDGYLYHYTHKDLSSMVEKTIAWSKIEAEVRFKANHPQMTWWRFPRVMLTAFFDSYIKKQGFKAGFVGILESLYQSFSAFVTFARLWELQRQSKKVNGK